MSFVISDGYKVRRGWIKKQDRYKVTIARVYEQDRYKVRRPGVYERDGYKVRRPGVYERDRYKVTIARVYEQDEYKVTIARVYEQDRYKVTIARVYEQDRYKVTIARVYEQDEYKVTIARVYEQDRYKVTIASIIPFFAIVTIRFKVENEIVSKYHFHDKNNLDDYSLIHEGSRVISIASKQEGVVTKKKVIEVDEIPVTTITVRWNNGNISHPYPHQIGVKLIDNLNSKQLTTSSY